MYCIERYGRIERCAYTSVLIREFWLYYCMSEWLIMCAVVRNVHYIVYVFLSMISISMVKCWRGITIWEIHEDLYWGIVTLDLSVLGLADVSKVASSLEYTLNIPILYQMETKQIHIWKPR